MYYRAKKRSEILAELRVEGPKASRQYEEMDGFPGSGYVSRLGLTIERAAYALESATGDLSAFVDWTARGIGHAEDCSAERGVGGIYAGEAAPMADACDCGLKDSMATLPEDVREAIASRWDVLRRPAGGQDVRREV